MQGKSGGEELISERALGKINLEKKKNGLDGFKNHPQILHRPVGKKA